MLEDVLNDFYESYEIKYGFRLTKEDKLYLNSSMVTFEVPFDIYSQTHFVDCDHISLKSNWNKSQGFGNKSQGFGYLKYFIEADLEYPDEPVMVLAGTTEVLTGWYRIIGAKLSKKEHLVFTSVDPVIPSRASRFFFKN